MKNISELSHCYGCSLCAVICPQQIITLCQDKEGFYQPVIEKMMNVLLADCVVKYVLSLMMKMAE